MKSELVMGITLVRMALAIRTRRSHLLWGLRVKSSLSSGPCAAQWGHLLHYQIADFGTP
jgi:hypothetical protein